MVNWHLSKQYLLTSITWSYYGLKFRAHRGHVFFGSGQLLNCWFTIGLRAYVTLHSCKQGRVVLEWVAPNPRLNQPNNKVFLYTNVFHCFCFVYFKIIQTQNRRPSRNTEILNAKLQTQIKISLILGFQQQSPGAPLFWLNLCSFTQLVDYCKSCILIGYATTGLLVIVIE